MIHDRIAQHHPYEISQRVIPPVAVEKLFLAKFAKIKLRQDAL